MGDRRSIKTPKHPEPYRGQMYFGGGVTYYPVAGGSGGRRLGQWPPSRGAGIGSIFSNVFRGVIPLVSRLFKTVSKTPVGKSLLKKAKKTGLKAGINVVSDTLRGENVLKSAKKHSKSAAKELKQGAVKTAVKALQGQAASSSSPRGRKKKNPRRKVVATSAGIAKRGRGGGGGGGSGGGDNSDGKGEDRKRKRQTGGGGGGDDYDDDYDDDDGDASVNPASVGGEPKRKRTKRAKDLLD